MVTGTPRMVTDGLVLCLDAANVKSYPGSGTTWTDLSQTAITGSLTNGTAFSSTNLGSVVFDGSNDYVDFGDMGNIGIDLSDKSICVWINKTANGNYGLVDKDFDNGTPNYGGWGFWIQSNNKLWWWNHANLDLLDNGTATVSNNTWTHCTVTYDYANKTARFYINGTLNSTRTNTNIVEKSSAGANFILGGIRVSSVFATAGQFFFPGRISTVHIYNRMITASEVLQNFEATRERFGV